jgi:hypothetical protein
MQLRNCSPDSVSAFASQKDQSMSPVRCSEQESDSESSSSPRSRPAKVSSQFLLAGCIGTNSLPLLPYAFIASSPADSYTIHLPSSIYWLSPFARALLTFLFVGRRKFSGGSKDLMEAVGITFEVCGYGSKRSGDTWMRGTVDICWDSEGRIKLPFALVSASRFLRGSLSAQ